MMIKSGDDYIKSLKEWGNVVYYNGQLVEDVTTHRGIIPHINSAAQTYEMALRPEHEDLMIATSHLTGKKINRFTHIHQSPDDLVKKVQML
ncbi:MAG: 4-hydroxybutyryl-CoA dehydratase, partial [Deltaproteobacteria bacterium]|nr:4-hydroxybutyryl-CoA dehydratase [Deltaproteobacteria bacterium]